MTIEGDILKKLKSVKEGIKELKKVESATNFDNKGGCTTVNGKISYSTVNGKSSVMFLFDATGSMAGLWDETKKVMNEMVERITKVGNVQLKCVAYRDYCDGDRLFEVSGWHNKAGPLLDFIGRIRCDGGGDEPEAVEDALELAYKEQETITRVILIGDASPHSLERAGEQASNLGKKGIPVFAFLVGESYNAGAAFSNIAELSNGKYGNLKNYRDLLDLMSIAIVHDVGGSTEVEKYIKKYGASSDVREYSRSLPSYKK